MRERRWGEREREGETERRERETEERGKEVGDRRPYGGRGKTRRGGIEECSLGCWLACSGELSQGLDWGHVHREGWVSGSLDNTRTPSLALRPLALMVSA